MKIWLVGFWGPLRCLQSRLALQKQLLAMDMVIMAMKACANDYHRHCPQYDIETEALRLCMDKAGQALSKTCVDAIVDAGEVSKAEVERRKRSGR
jgi:hypothetical protein